MGDRVIFTPLDSGAGILDEILPRRNEFQRPAVANIDQLVVIASGAIPVTDPFLIDRVVSIAEGRNCQPVICINKCDLDAAEELYQTYRAAGFPTLRVSAETGEGLEELSGAIAGKASAFTGNSGVGKSSILNALEPGFRLQVGEVSDKLGRGRHTTRHVELFRLRSGAIVADTPGFSSFDTEEIELRRPEELQYTFREFAPYLEQCRFTGCSHVKEKGCAVLAAVKAGEIAPSRHASYVRLYQQAKEVPNGNGNEARTAFRLSPLRRRGLSPPLSGRRRMDGLLCRRRGTQRPCGRTAAGLSDRRLGLRRCAGERCPLHHASGGKGYDRLQAAVDQALELDYRELLLCGLYWGTASDHTASNLVLLEWIADHGGRALLVDADNEVRLLDSGVLRLTNRPCYHYLSLVPLDRRVTGVTCGDSNIR